jgi:hypothetical protein
MLTTDGHDKSEQLHCSSLSYLPGLVRLSTYFTIVLRYFETHLMLECRYSSFGTSYLTFNQGGSPQIG